MKRIISIITIGICMSINIDANESPLTQQELQTNIVINLAGKQRMLTQKMSKEALLIAKGINKEENQKNLQETIALFDKTLKGLRNGDADLHLPKTKDPLILEELDKLLILWKNFKVHVDRVAKGEVDKATLEAIDQGNIPLLKDMDFIVQLYENRYNTNIDPHLAHTINLAGRERMLTQKMTKELLLIANSLQSNANVQSLKSSGKLFQETMTSILSDPESLQNPEISSRLMNVQQLWNEYQKIVANMGMSDQEREIAQAKEQEINQKMTQSLLELAKIVDANAYKKRLKQTGELFDSTLHALIDGDTKMGLMGTKDQAIKAQLLKVQKLWDDYKNIISNADVSDQGLQKAIAINMPLLQQMNKAVTMYEQQSTKTSH